MYTYVYIYIYIYIHICISRCSRPSNKNKLLGAIIRKELPQPPKLLSCLKAAAVSRMHGVPIQGPLKTPRTSQYYRIEEFKGDPELVPHYVERRQPLRQQI